MSLVATFTSVERLPGVLIPIEMGSKARTERIAIDSGTDGLDVATGTLTAADDENVVVLYAASACWVAIGQNPVAAPAPNSPTASTAGTSRFLPAGTEKPFMVRPGDRVSVTGIEVA